MEAFVLLTVTGLGLAAMYFLIASGLSLIYGLMGVLNFAHGAFLSVGAYAAWWLDGRIDGIGSLTVRFLIGAAFGLAVGAVLAALVELVLIRPLYQRHIEQVLVTVGLSLVIAAVLQGSWGPEVRLVTKPEWLVDTTTILGARIPNDRFLEIAAAIVVLLGLRLFLRRTRYGLIIRAGVENRAMVTALGIDVRKAFTLVFAIGGVAAALAGVLSGVYFGGIDPSQGTSLLIFAFIVVVIGGLGSIEGSAVAAVVVGLTQQYANYYASSGLGDLSVVLLLAIVLLVRPSGLAGKWAVGIETRARDRRSAGGGGRSRLRAEGGVRHARVVRVRAELARHASGARADAPIRGRCALLRPALRTHGAALVRARAALRRRRLPVLDRPHQMGMGFSLAILFALAVGLLLPVLLGTVALRVGGIAFAMVTLAFAQAGQVLVQKNPDQLTGGEDGLGLNYEGLPESFVGVFNTKNLYWLALGYLIVVTAIVWWATASSPGKVWQAIRENEKRVEVLGFRPFPYKLMVFVLASFLASGGGIVYALLIGSATPHVTTASFTLSLLIMVVIGGAGTRWGAILGGALYIFLDHRLPAVASSERVQDLPGVLRTPLSEPLFVLGTLFILIVFFLPGGIAGLRRRGLRQLEGRVDEPPVGPTPQPEPGT